MTLYNKLNFFSSGFAVKYFCDQLEHVSILVSDFHPVQQLLTATRAEIYFHYSSLVHQFQIKLDRGKHNSFSKVFDDIFIF